MWTFFLVLYFKENNDTSIQLLEYNLKLTKKDSLLFLWGETIVKSLPMATASSLLPFLLSVVCFCCCFANLAFLFPSSVLHQMVIHVFLFQVLHFYCDTCSVPICRECTMGRHVGHSFIYLQDALQDSRTLTIQLLADAQQGRQAIQVRYSQLKYLIFFSVPHSLPGTGQGVRQKALCCFCQLSHPFCSLRSDRSGCIAENSTVMNFAFLQHNPDM